MKNRLLHFLCLLAAASLPTEAICATITEGAKTAEVRLKDAYGYRWDSIVAGLLAIKYQPAILDDTVTMERLLPGLSCESVRYAGDEFEWRKRKPALVAELKAAAASFNGADIYSLSLITLGDYDFNAAGFPFKGEHLGFSNFYVDGAPVGKFFGGPGTEGGAIDVPYGFVNLHSVSTYSMSPQCNLALSGNGIGALETKVMTAGAVYKLNTLLQVSEEDARQLIKKYPQRQFVLMYQAHIGGSALSRDGRTVFLKAEREQYSICDGANPPLKLVNGIGQPGEPSCERIIRQVALVPYSGPYQIVPELPPWTLGNHGGGTHDALVPVQSAPAVNGGQTAATGPASGRVTINASDLVHGIGSLFGSANKQDTKAGDNGQSTQDPPPNP